MTRTIPASTQPMDRPEKMLSALASDSSARVVSYPQTEQTPFSAPASFFVAARSSVHWKLWAALSICSPHSHWCQWYSALLSQVSPKLCSCSSGAALSSGTSGVGVGVGSGVGVGVGVGSGVTVAGSALTLM